MRTGGLDLSERKEEENQETNSIQWRERFMGENLLVNISRKTVEAMRRAKERNGKEYWIKYNSLILTQGLH